MFLNLTRMVGPLHMPRAPVENIGEAIDEVLDWASMFDHHLGVSDLLRHLRIECSEQALLEVIKDSPCLRIDEGMVVSTKHTRNPNFAEQQRMAKEHLHDTGLVLGILAACPYVTGLSITGSVAAGMNRKDGDVDVLIITKPGWVWRVRALAIYLSHKHPKGALLCPNMVMSQDTLEFTPSLYSAREMMQMIPVKDTGGLAHLYEVNHWVCDVLPNAKPKPRLLVQDERGNPWWWRVMTLPLLGSLIERWESSRRIKQLTVASGSSEAIYTKSVCRGHEHEHKQRIEATYAHVREAMP